MSIIADNFEGVTDCSGELTEEERKVVDGLEDCDSPKPVTLYTTGAVERQILTLIVQDGEYLGKIARMLKPNMFVDRRNEAIAGVLLSYWSKFKSGPTRDILNAEVRRAIQSVPGEDQQPILDRLEAVQSAALPATSRAYLEAELVNYAKAAGTKRVVKDVVAEMKRNGAADIDLAAIIGELVNIQNIGDASTQRRAWTIPDLAALKPVEWQIQGHIPEESFSVIYGPFGCGKSFVALDMALAVATGKPYLERHAVKQGAVCYLAAEGYRGVYKRIRAWLDTHKQEVPTNFVLLPDTYDLHGDVGAAASIAELARQTLGENPSLFIIDTVARNFGAGDENSTQDMNQFVANVAALGKASRATTLCVHHSGKDFKRGARGAVSLGAACDAMFELSGVVTDAVTIENVKQKDAAGQKAYVVVGDRVDVDGEPDGSLAMRWVGLVETQIEDQATADAGFKAKHDDENYKLLIHLPEQGGAGGLSQAELCDKLDWSQAKVSRVVARLKEAGSIVAEDVASGGTSGRKAARYTRGTSTEPANSSIQEGSSIQGRE